MNTSNINSEEKWKEQVNEFNQKVDQLKDDMNSYKIYTKETKGLKQPIAFIPKVKPDMQNLNNKLKQVEVIDLTGDVPVVIGRCHLKGVGCHNPLVKRNSQNTIKFVKNKKEEPKKDAVIIPISKDATIKHIKTSTTIDDSNKNRLTTTHLVRNKRKTKQGNKINTTMIKNEVKQEIEVIPQVSKKEEIVLNKKSKKSKYLCLTKEDGNTVMHQVFRDEDVGFCNITKLDDENLCKVKKENRDDDDIKTSTHLAQWSSDLVQKYIKETIEKSKIYFLNSNVRSREKELMKRIE